MNRPSIPRLTVVAGALVAAFIACSEPTGTTSTSLRADDGAKALKCPTDQSVSESANVGPLGGLVTALPTATSIALPAGSLLGLTNIEVTVPASKYMLVDITADDAEHFLFALPVTVTIDYSRCDASEVGIGALSVYVLDPEDNRLTDKMVSVDNRLLRRITFATDHLTSYVVAE
jgi:hypothetical protein